jgi:NitT/TauT family transport system substrate-binding protein
MDLRAYGVRNVIELAPMLVAMQRMTNGRGKVHHGSLSDLVGADPTMNPANPAFDGTAAVKALAQPAADIDVVTNAETQLLRYSAERPDLRILMNLTEGLYRIVGRRSSGIGSIKDLKGKRIATFPRTSAAYYLFKELKSVGLSENDVTIVSLFPIGEITKAIVAGDVDASAIWEPSPQESFEQLGDNAIELRTPGIYRELFNLNSTADKLADPVKRGQIVVFVRHLLAAIAQINRDPDEAIRLVASHSGYDIALVRRCFPHYRWTGNIPSDLLDCLVEGDPWSAREFGRKPRTREELAKLIDDSVYREALGGAR